MILTSLDILSVLESISSIYINYSEPPTVLVYDAFCLDIYENKEVMKDDLEGQIWGLIDGNMLWSRNIMVYFLTIDTEHYIETTDRPDIFETKCLVRFGYDLQ